MGEREERSLTSSFADRDLECLPVQLNHTHTRVFYDSYTQGRMNAHVVSWDSCAEDEVEIFNIDEQIY